MTFFSYKKKLWSWSKNYTTKEYMSKTLKYDALSAPYLAKPTLLLQMLTMCRIDLYVDYLLTGFDIIQQGKKHVSKTKYT